VSDRLGGPLPERIVEICQRLFVDAVPFVMAQNIRFVEASYGIAVMGLDWQENLVGDPEQGILGGGVITNMMDQTTGMAAFTRFEKPRTFATLDLRVDYLKPAGRGRSVHVRGECFRMTRSIAFTRGMAYHPDDPDHLIATASATFMLDSSPLPQMKVLP
jgi:uncharacterized protein (TIGR00369 family)